MKEYNKTSQIEFNNVVKNEHGYVAGDNNKAATVTFNDNGKANNHSAMDAVGLNMMLDIVNKIKK